MKTKLFFAITFLFISTICLAQRKNYEGRKHTTSHGGAYSGGRGTSHKGGHYKNTATHNTYGKHKRK
ncbi:hypothetical protein ACI6Q2_18960 [Chitinophagaceae bacterium LWZ2-11]